jgi:HK97 gp10 family phage protein
MGVGVMAKMTIMGIDEYAMKLSKLGEKASEIAKRAVKAGANPVADEIRKELKKNLSGSKYSTGDLLNSLGIAPPDVDHQGNTNTKIGFAGYDRNGVPNALKARAMESGTSTQPKRPFVRPAVNRAKKKALEEMGKSIDADLRIFALDK